MSEATISLVDDDVVRLLFGTCDQHLHKIRDSLGVDVFHRDGEIHVAGAEGAVSQATETLVRLRAMAEKHGGLEIETVEEVLASVMGTDGIANTDPIQVLAAGRQIRPRTPGQARYVTAMRKHDLVFAVGPAGTGKTYLAVAQAVEALRSELIRKIVLVRPAVEAGERLGFLPGDLQAKINPYLRPLLDALNEMVDYEQIQRYVERDVIEVIPLAFMRGRTLNEAFIILDEAQNTTVGQMKMFLTRMGASSKMVVSGDNTQNDLPPNTTSGLTDALNRLKSIRGTCQVKLTKADIVRHRLVQDIVTAYEEGPKKRGR